MRSLIENSADVCSGLRFRLVVLLAVAFGPLVAMMLHSASDERRRTLANWPQRARKVSESVASQEEALISQTRQLLLALADSSAACWPNRAICQELVDELFASCPRYANLGVIQTNGEILASALSFSRTLETADPDAETPGPLRNWRVLPSGDFFRRVLETRSFAIGDCSFCQGTDARMVGFGCPVFRRQGQIQAVAFATADWSRSSPLTWAPPALLPKGATWAELDAHGQTLARYPDAEPVRSEVSQGKWPVSAALAQPMGLVKWLDGEGVPTVGAFVLLRSRLLPNAQLGVLAIPERLLFARANQQLGRNLVWLGLAAALALAVVWFGGNYLILGPINALAGSTLRLACGDWTARSGLKRHQGELGLLTSAFDRMAQMVEEREREGRRATNRLRTLSHKLVEVQESERRHIARELHDEIGQSLSLAEMNLQAALSSEDRASLPRRLEQSVRAVQRVLGQVRDLSLNLRPSMLDDLGLEPALRWYTNRQAIPAGLDIEVRIEPMAQRLEPLIETGCFRVAQEALTNVVRHAQAHHVTVQLGLEDERLHLCVRDDGIGFEVGPVRAGALRGASLGLLSMEERATLAGGRLELRSAPGQGTEVHAWFPLKWQLVA